MNKETIDAAALYSCALKENQAELMVPLENCKLFYVPNMPHFHRTVWFEANLIIFYNSFNNEEFGDDCLSVSDALDGTRRRLYFCTVKDDNYHLHIANMAEISFFCPTYIEINPKLLLKIIKLLVFT